MHRELSVQSWVHFSNDTHETAYKNALKHGISIALIGMVIIAAAGLLIGFLLTRRLDELGQVAREYAQGNFAARVTIKGDEEIKNLGRTLNTMAEEISHSLVSLKESEESFRTIFNFANDATFLIDPRNDRIINANTAASKLLKYEHKDLLETPISAMHTNDLSKTQEFVSEVLEKGSAISDELSCLTKNNEPIQASISASKIHIDGKKYILAQIRNITEA